VAWATDSRTFPEKGRDGARSVVAPVVVAVPVVIPVVIEIDEIPRDSVREMHEVVDVIQQVVERPGGAEPFLITEQE
jgi:hypothetical protein